MLERPIPVIGDEYVDREFGTGAVKITPGHDFNDYEIGQRHRLPIISIMNKDASLNKNAGPYAGLELRGTQEIMGRFNGKRADDQNRSPHAGCAAQPARR